MKLHKENEKYNDSVLLPEPEVIYEEIPQITYV